ncbi:MAG: iron ABC transporter permease [Bacteroidales bacterium]|nr:iron ABC transporter permease [Bacteroidales bacterium]MBR5029326.1 iron ABC transporter permease [Bacteroidales bacterium]
MKNSLVTRRRIVLPILVAVLLLLMLAATMIGIVGFSPASVVDNLWRGLSGEGADVIFWNLRLPRIVLCVLIGAVLSVSGGTYQAVFRNPLTDPYVLGISSGASLGAAVAILLGLEGSFFGVGLLALATALLTVVLIYKIASLGNRMHTATLLLTGVCFTFLATAIVSFLMVINQDKMDRIIFWTMGSFASVSWTDVLIMLPVAVAGIAVVLYHSKDLNLLLVGSETAKSLGVEVEKVKKILLLATTLMVAFAVSACGVIGFVGLVVPHCIRLVAGSDNRLIIPYSIVVGGIFLLLCDTLSRTVLMPSEIPVGSVTALVGAPMFIYLLYKSKKRY